MQVEAALTLERAERRRAYCEATPGDRDCWGTGGRAVHDDLLRRVAERDAYCATAPDDARCWSAAERRQRDAVWAARIEVASRPPPLPDGPPPAALAELVPPRLSASATWRPGYWHWTGADWLWLGGMWRVPDADLVAGATTTAPTAPPPLRTETPPPAPHAAVAWVAGFWQWDGTTWVWIAGSWQLRPSAGVRWRAASWERRGVGFVLVPGAWISGGSR
ncbi:MAG: hypothetical protein R2939_07710 [Kofleriaceae bacterium]